MSIWRTVGVGVHIRPASWFDGRNGVDEDEYGISGWTYANRSGGERVYVRGVYT